MAFLCTMCDKREEDCTCDKFCTICKSSENLRLVGDGCYYCLDCREACDLQAEN